MSNLYQIITFYEFKNLHNLNEIKESLKLAMHEHSILGTIILANEGFNSTVGGEPQNIQKFIDSAEVILETRLTYKSSYHSRLPFRKIKIKIKHEIVTLKKKIEIEKGAGTHVKPRDWNKLLNDSEAVVLDARNHYEYKSGTFKGAINPETGKFSDLPEFVAKNFDPNQHKKIAMFCTGGIRCEKIAPYLKDLGFEEIYQLEGGILKYLEEIPSDENLWEGECFVFDERITVDERLRQGSGVDHSQKIGKK